MFQVFFQGEQLRCPSTASSNNPSGIAPPPPYSPQRPTPRQDVLTTVERPGPSSGTVSQGIDPSRNNTAQMVPVAGARDYRSRPGHGTTEVTPQFPLPPAPSDRRARSSSRTGTNERSQPLFSLSALTSRVRSSSQLAGSRHADVTYSEGAGLQNEPVGNARRAFTVHAG